MILIINVGPNLIWKKCFIVNLIHIINIFEGGGGTAQLVTLTGGGQVRPGQIVQVAGQPGQHQIVVSQSGQIVLQPPTSKQMWGRP